MSKKVLKMDGSIEEFDRQKLVNSIRNSGADIEIAEDVTKFIEKSIVDGDSTKEIYEKAFSELHKMEPGSSFKYSLKKAIFAFGPTGFPFEKYISCIFNRLGNESETNVYLQGRCVLHEIDVLLKSPEKVAIEVKFHGSHTGKSDLKTVLYVNSRFYDLTKKDETYTNVVDRGILVTNTRFTRNAIKYAECSGLELLGWAYPRKHNLRDYIYETKTHPITCIPRISRQLARVLFEHNLITCRDLLDNTDLLRKHNLLTKDMISILDDSKLICG